MMKANRIKNSKETKVMQEKKNKKHLNVIKDLRKDTNFMCEIKTMI